MKHNTTPYSIIKSELLNSGHSEFVNKEKNQLVFFDDDFQIIKKIMRYDDDVKKIVNEKIFQNLTLETTESDNHFKQTFINRFLNRQFNRQTLEMFSAQIVYTFLANENYINYLYDDIDDYLKNKQITDSSGDSEKQNDYRYLTSSLPQNEINLNVDDTELDYGDTNTIARTRDKNTEQSDSSNERFDLDTLIKFNGLFEQVFNKFDENCFLQTW